MAMLRMDGQSGPDEGLRTRTTQEEASTLCTDGGGDTGERSADGEEGGSKKKEERQEGVVGTTAGGSWEDALPPELWCEVFTHLTTREGLGLVSFVCRRWRLLYLSRGLLRFHVVPPAWLAARARAQSRYDVVEPVAGASGDFSTSGVSATNRVNKKDFRKFMLMLRQQTSALASLSFSPISASNMSWLSNPSPQQPSPVLSSSSSSPSPSSSPPASPQTLSVTSVATAGNMWINDKFIRKYISGGFRALTELDLTNCRLLTAACLPHLPRSLRRLNLRGCRNIVDPSFSHASSSQLFGTVSPSSSPPRSLNSVYGSLVPPPLVDDDEEVDAPLPIIVSTPTLVIMDFSSVPSPLLSESTLPNASSSASSSSSSFSGATMTNSQPLPSGSILPPNLQVLSFAYCWGLRDKMLTALPRSLRKLSLPDCKSLTSKGLLHLAALTQLEVLDLAQCTQAVTDDVLDTILPTLTRLRELDLSYCKNISHEGLHHLSRLTDLRTLDLVFCKKLSPRIFEYLPSTLHNLNLAYCFFMKNKGDVPLPFPPELRKLNLAGCELLTDGAFRDVAVKVPHLNHLNVAECYRLSDIGLSYLSTCQELKTLDISYCSSITDAGMLELLPASLQMLTLRSIFDATKSRDNLGNRLQKLTHSIKVEAIEKLLQRIEVDVSNLSPSQKPDFRFTQPW